MNSAASVSTWQNFKRLLTHATPYKYGFIAAIIGMVFYAAIDSYVLSQLRPLIDQGLTGKDPEFMRWAPVFVLVMFCLRGICHFVGNYCLAWVGNNVVSDIRQKLFDHIMAMPVSFHDKESTGNLISKITYDAEQLLTAVSKAVIVLVQQGAFVIGLLAVMFYSSWQLSSIFLVLIPFIAIVMKYVSKRFRSVSKRIQGAMGQVTTTTEQTFNGHKVVLTFGGQARESERFSEINKQNRQQRMKLVAARSISVPIIQIIAAIGLAFILYFANLESMREHLTAGAFTTVMVSMTAMLGPLKQLTRVNAEFQRGMAAAASIFEVLDKDTELDQGNKPLIRATGEFAFENVSFQYANQDRKALDKVSFHARPGETIALVGRSGSGKSTASSLLLRFYDVTEGKVLIDGENITDYQLADLRKQFAYVSQQVVLFNDTLANNIAYGKPDASEAEILAAAKSAHVWEFAQHYPEGLNTEIGENGTSLSGGQRQRVAIARAILCDAPFLILDEATSALDTESERHIQDALQTLQKNRTSIVIAHRLSTIESADKILVMDGGKILEQGDHQTLLAKQGAYAQLYNLQFSQ